MNREQHTDQHRSPGMTSLLTELCCPPVLDEPLTQQDAERVAAAFKTIADPARLRLLGLIRSQPNQEACTCDLTAPLGLSQPTVSHHLKTLYDAGLLEREKRGRNTWYRIAPAGLGTLRDAIDPAR